jgi:hypothetical protein
MASPPARQGRLRHRAAHRGHQRAVAGDKPTGLTSMTGVRCAAVLNGDIDRATRYDTERAWETGYFVRHERAKSDAPERVEKTGCSANSAGRAAPNPIR